MELISNTRLYEDDKSAACKKNSLQHNDNYQAYGRKKIMEQPMYESLKRGAKIDFDSGG